MAWLMWSACDAADPSVVEESRSDAMRDSAMYASTWPRYARCCAAFGVRPRRSRAKLRRSRSERESVVMDALTRPALRRSF